MDSMPSSPEWTEIAVRLALALVGGALLGFDRTSRARAAGMRTTMLVCLAAGVAMVLGNLLLAARAGPSSFDPLRIAQGILAGMGFIGAGAIVRRDDMVLGVTTAATLWYASIVGLCFGAGEWEIGAGAVALGCFVLWVMQLIEDRIKRECAGTLRVLASLEGPDLSEVRQRIECSGYAPASWSVKTDRSDGLRAIACRVTWRAPRDDERVPEFVGELEKDARVRRVVWVPSAS
jgi:putative Mg2+ transporter-C (MgtC) family protein